MSCLPFALETSENDYNHNAGDQEKSAWNNHSMKSDEADRVHLNSLFRVVRDSHGKWL
jgi:hypothetical protein